jgi:Sec-independent protein translocase protein TatA
MGKIGESLKRISLTEWLLVVIIVLLALNLAELRLINESIGDIWAQLTRPR